MSSTADDRISYSPHRQQMSSDTPINECSLPPEWAAALDQYESGYGPVRTYIRDLHRDLAAMTARAEAAERDSARLARLVEFVDGIGDVDLHERAALYASHRGNEEPDASDYLAAARDAIDAAREGK